MQRSVRRHANRRAELRWVRRRLQHAMHRGICPLIGPSCDGGTQPSDDQACLTIDSTNAYWGTGFAVGGTVWKVPLGGGCPQLMIGNQDSPHAMASDGTNLYFANLGTGNTLGSVQMIPINGNVATPIATIRSGPLGRRRRRNERLLDEPGRRLGVEERQDDAESGQARPARAATATPRTCALDSTYVYFTDHTSGLVKTRPDRGRQRPSLRRRRTGVALPRDRLARTPTSDRAANGTSAILSIALERDGGHARAVAAEPHVASTASRPTARTSGTQSSRTCSPYAAEHRRDPSRDDRRSERRDPRVEAKRPGLHRRRLDERLLDQRPSAG